MTIGEVHRTIWESRPGKCWNGLVHLPKLPFLTLELLKTKSIRGPKQTKESGRAKAAEPVCLVVGRRNRKIQNRALLVPYATVVAGGNSESECSRGKIRIVDLAQCGGLAPRRIHPLKPVAIAHGFGI